jgi:hypothetical protein
LLHTTTPFALVTVNEGEVGPIAMLQLRLDAFRIDDFITTIIPGP